MSVGEKAVFGVSVSAKQCRAFKLQATDVIDFVAEELNIRRFRLMSYWNEIEKQQGSYDFSELDRQLAAVSAVAGEVSLCLGMRQPRWPETHIPKWALKLTRQKRYRALYEFIETVMLRYRDNPTIVSWQLENEALNRNFGRNGDFNRQRLRIESMLVRELDDRPLVMSLSDTIGLPLRKPRPDIYAVSFYRVIYENGAYQPPRVPWWLFPARGRLIKLLTRRKMFIHELQAEPWGPKAIWQMNPQQQAESMNTEQLAENIRLARQTGLYPIDLWGAEWWLNRYRSGDTSVIDAIRNSITP